MKQKLLARPKTSTIALLVLAVLSIIGVLVMRFAEPPAALAQGGQLAGITWSGQVMTNVIGVGATSTFPNYGFAAHWLTYCVTNATSIAIELEGSDNGTSWICWRRLIAIMGRLDLITLSWKRAFARMSLLTQCSRKHRRRWT